VAQQMNEEQIAQATAQAEDWAPAEAS